ncbi:hypothetical protein [Micropruina sp.]|uniref:hypothetical protein n=1 Tax=Micropruina sp. TaxID=2737536 RepID=UPI0039E27F75
MSSSGAHSSRGSSPSASNRAMWWGCWAGWARFVDPDHYEVLWKQSNGLLLSPVLLDDRLRAHWRLAGTARRRVLPVTLFAGSGAPAGDELASSVRALELALGIAVAEVANVPEADAGFSLVEPVETSDMPFGPWVST